MRVIHDGAQVTEAPKTITGATQADPVVITSAAHGFSDGDEVVIAGVLGMTEINGRNFKVANVATNTFELKTMDGVNLDGTGFTPYSSAGTASRIYEIVTPYAEADLATLNYVQSGDVITIVHPNYAPRELSRTSHTSWVIAAIDFTPGIDSPFEILVAAGAGGAETFRYQVTAIKEDTAEESLPGYEEGQSGSVNLNVTPWEMTITGHGYTTGDRVLIDSNGIPVAYLHLTGETFTITVTSVDTFTLGGTTANGGGTHTQTARRSYAEVVSAAVPSEAAPILITWNAVDGAKEYVVYKELNGVYGFIGVAFDVAGVRRFADTNIAPDTTDTPPDDPERFLVAGDFPSVVSYYQQRLIFGNSDNEPEKIWASQTGNYHNFTQATPTQDDDPVTFTPNGRRVNEIRAIMDLGKLTIFTSGGIHAALGNGDGALLPTSVNLRQQSYVGSSSLQPIPIGSSALFVQARGSIVQDLNFDVNIDGYKGNEVSIFSSHLFERFTLTDWDYQEIPHSIVWAVRDDGQLLGLTYLRSQDVYGWHHHDTTNGLFEKVISIPEGDEDTVYVVVSREIDGRSVRYIERLHTRVVDDIRADAFFVDSGLTYDGRNETATTMTLSGGTTWEYTEDLTLTASASFFTSLEVGNAIELVLRTEDDDGVEQVDRLFCTITAYSSATVVTVRADKNVPVAFRSVAFTEWSRAIDVVNGLHHLENETVAILSDGTEVAQQTVTEGQITLARPFSVIHVGLPITSDFETLSLDVLNAETILDKRKLINKATVLVEDSRAMFVGPNLANLQEWDQRDVSDSYGPIEMFTGNVEILTGSTWETNGRVAIRQVSPLPITILSVIPSGRVGG